MKIDSNFIFQLTLLTNALLVLLIIMTQKINYPLFLYVRSEDFNQYHNFYTNAVTKIVLPLMAIEMVSNLFLLLINYNNIYFFSQIIIFLIWLSTFFIQVPLHNKINKNYDELLVKKLIKSNWIRTSLWFLKFCLLFYFYRGF
ncbi:MAG: hypothetical protein CMF96_05080 [Candidatus Marinimicrobia bacterium]|nr:hypothetical protein [Candidatus Neomarinimicrobiota bacterium]|tara:strand:+ start:6936 stop:7364 length:429 start_codon:yes stop_codon:yes gene_type:complete